MSIQDEIVAFDEKFHTVDAELDEVNKQVGEFFEKKLIEIYPIISHLKKKTFYFLHPDLNTSIYTSVGAIIGRNIRNEREVFVYDGSPLIKTVDTFNSRDKAEERPMALNHFFSECDLDFALKGIDYVRDSFERILRSYQETAERKRAFIQKVTQN